MSNIIVGGANEIPSPDARGTFNWARRRLILVNKAALLLAVFFVAPVVAGEGAEDMPSSWAIDDVVGDVRLDVTTSSAGPPPQMLPGEVFAYLDVTKVWIVETGVGELEFGFAFHRFEKPDAPVQQFDRDLLVAFFVGDVAHRLRVESSAPCPAIVEAADSNGLWNEVGCGKSQEDPTNSAIRAHVPVNVMSDHTATMFGGRVGLQDLVFSSRGTRNTAGETKTEAGDRIPDSGFGPPYFSANSSSLVLSVVGASTLALEAGASHKVGFVLDNRASHEVAVRIRLAGPDAHWARASPDEIVLDPTSEEVFTLVVVPPDTASAGSTGRFEVRVQGRESSVALTAVPLEVVVLPQAGKDVDPLHRRETSGFGWLVGVFALGVGVVVGGLRR